MVDEFLGRIVPIYVVADTSDSMAAEVDQINDSLVDLLDRLQGESMAAAKTRLCVLGFDEQVHRYLGPTDVRELEEMPQLVCGGTRSFAALFGHLRTLLSGDITSFRLAGYAVGKPVIFLLTGGSPDNAGANWEPLYLNLMDPEFEHAPLILAFGIGDSDVNIIRHLASEPRFAFASASPKDVGRALIEWISGLTQS